MGNINLIKRSIFKEKISELKSKKFSFEINRIELPNGHKGEYGYISASEVTLGGTSKGNINSDNVKIKATADVDGVLNQKNLSIEDGAKLKIKAETY